MGHPWSNLPAPKGYEAGGVRGEVPRALLAGRAPLRVSSASREVAGLLGAVLSLRPTSSVRQAMQLHPRVYT